MIPGDLITHTMPRPHGMPGSLEGVWVRHTSGGISKLALKSYEQGRKSFEGTARDFIWCDEEPPDACYTEMLLRTLTTKGVIFVTFTPLQGVSEVVKGFLEPDNQEAAKYKFYVQAGWKDVPHLDEEQKKNLLVTTPRYQLRGAESGFRRHLPDFRRRHRNAPRPDSGILAAGVRHGRRLEPHGRDLGGTRPGLRRDRAL
jgi:phage terminase large subunit-like protein